MELRIILVLLLGECVLLSAQSARFDQRIPEGDDVTVPCANEGRVSWSKLADGRRELVLTAEPEQAPVKHKPDPGHRYRVLPDLSLVIREVSGSDSGIYYCNATPVVDLHVTPVKARFDQRIPEGDDVTVPCANEGRVSWSKLADGRRELVLTAEPEQAPVKHKPDPGHRYRVLPDLSLVIREVSGSDSGIYYCNATPVVDLHVTSVKGGVNSVERQLLVYLFAVPLFLTALH